MSGSQFNISGLCKPGAKGEQDFTGLGGCEGNTGRGPFVLRVCCRCQSAFGTKPCAPEQHGMVTHGYCDHCVTIVRREAGLPAKGVQS